MATETKDLRGVGIGNIDWSHPEDALGLVHQHAERTAREAIDWYWRSKLWKRRLGLATRFVAILGAAIGGLIPLISAAQDGDGGLSSKWGYVALAAAAACISLDKFFGYSITWTRYVSAATALETELVRYQMDWQRMLQPLCGRPVSCEQVGPFLARASELLARVRKEVEDETRAWMDEFRSNLSAVGGEIEKLEAAQRPGAVEIDLTLEGAPEQGIAISLDGRVVQTLSGPRGAIRPVFPGQHRVEARARISGTECVDQRIVMVPPGGVVSVRMELPPQAAP